MTKEERIERGNRVKRLLSDEDFQQAVAFVRMELFQAWQESAYEPQREALHAEHRGLQRVMDRLMSWKDDAAMLSK